MIKHTTDVNCLGIFFTLTYKMRKGSLMIVSFSSLISSLCKYFYYLNLDPRSLNLCLDLKYLDGKGVKRLIKHTNRLEILKYILHLDIQNEKRDDKRIFISHLFMLQIVLLPLTWLKESRSVFKFVIAWLEEGKKVDQTHKRTWNAR